jgi:hypothetical protein
MAHIKDIPLEEWPPGWLKLEVASILRSPDYIIMNNREKKDAGMPVSAEEMREFIKSHQ